MNRALRSSFSSQALSAFWFVWIVSMQYALVALPREKKKKIVTSSRHDSIYPPKIYVHLTNNFNRVKYCLIVDTSQLTRKKAKKKRKPTSATRFFFCLTFLSTLAEPNQSVHIDLRYDDAMHKPTTNSLVFGNRFYLNVPRYDLAMCLFYACECELYTTLCGIESF